MEDRAGVWFRQRSSHWRDWPLDRLLESKQRQGARISVVIPARDEERTVAGVVTGLSNTGLSNTGLSNTGRWPTPEAL